MNNNNNNNLVIKLRKGVFYEFLNNINVSIFIAV